MRDVLLGHYEIVYLLRIFHADIQRYACTSSERTILWLEAHFLRQGTAPAHVVTGKLTSADEHYQQEILDIEKVRKSIDDVYDSTGRKSI